MKIRSWAFPVVLTVAVGFGVFVMYSIWGAVSPRTAQNYKDTGKQYLDQEKYPEAIVEFLNAVQIDPRERDARFFLARSYMAQNDLTSATKQLGTLLEYFPDDKEANIQLGSIYLTGGGQNPEFFRQSREIAEKVLAKDAQNIPALVLLGNALAGLRDYTSSIEHFEQALRLDPENSSTLLGLGAAETLRKNYAEAEQAFLKARQLDLKNKAALISLGGFYSASGKPAEAETTFKEALALFPGDRQVYRAAAAYYYQAMRFEEAEKTLKDAQAASPADPGPALMLLSYYRAQHRASDAQTLLRDLKARFPRDTTVSLELAAALMLDDPATSRREIDAILKANPRNVPAQVLLGESQFRARQYDQSVKTLSAPSVLNSRYPKVHLFLGLIDVSKGQINHALDHYKSSLDRDPGYSPSRLALAGLLLRLGRLEDTKVELKRVLEVQPNSLEARLLNASVDTLERRFADAERELTLLQKELPNNSNVHLRTALYYQIRGFAPQAEKSFLRALELSPDSEDILTNVAQFYMLQRKTDQAVKVIADALPDAKKRAFHHELIGKVYSHAGHSTEAETAFKKALSMEPDRVDVIAELASEYINARRYDDALKQLDELLKRMPLNAKAYVMKGMIFQAKDDLNQAKESYDRALKIDPDQFAAANNLAYLLAEQGRDLEVALTWAQTARRLQPDSHVTADTLGWVQHKMGRDILARDQLQFAVSQQPDNPTYQYHLAMTYKETKQIPQAQAALKKAFGSKETFKEKSLAETALQELSSAK